MGLFDKIFRPDRAKESARVLKYADDYFKTLTAYRPVFTTWCGEIYESELVRAAIDARARHISKLSVELLGTAKPSLQSKLRQGPNEWQTWGQFLYRASSILDVYNTLFITPVVDAELRVTGYYPLIPNRCEIVEYEQEAWLRYQFTGGDTAAVKLRDCAIMTRFQLRDDFFGENNDPLNGTMELINLQRQGIQEAVKNGATFRFMAQTNNFTKADDLAEERKRFSRENLTRDAEAGGLLLFPNTYKDIKQLTQQAYTVDADQMKLIQTNVFNYFGVNEDVLQNKAYGDAWSAFYEGAVEVFSVQFSDCMTRAMFSERERAAGSMLMATANRLQYLSNADKLNVSAQMADRGIMSINEIRAIWNLAPVDGGDVRIARGEYKEAENGNSD